MKQQIGTPCGKPIRYAWKNPHKFLEKFSKNLYGTTGGTYSSRFLRPVTNLKILKTGLNNRVYRKRFFKVNFVFNFKTVQQCALIEHTEKMKNYNRVLMMVCGPQ